MKPTIYLSNAASKRTNGHHGEGVMVCAMAKPRPWEEGAGRCYEVAPNLSDLEAIQAGQIGMVEYRRRYEAGLAEVLANGWLAPGIFDYWRRVGGRCKVAVGDTLICGCARWAKGKKRAHPCHLELLAPHLHAAGWEVVLWGTIYNPAIHTPSFFGWPNV